MRRLDSQLLRQRRRVAAKLGARLCRPAGGDLALDQRRHGRLVERVHRQQLARHGDAAVGPGLGLQVGVRTRVDVLNAEQQLFATRKDLAAARYKTLVATLQLKAAAGSLAEADLRALDALLND